MGSADPLPWPHGDRLRAAIRRAGHPSYLAFCRSTAGTPNHVPWGTLSWFLSGKRGPSRRTLGKLLRALGLTELQFLAIVPRPYDAINRNGPVRRAALGDPAALADRGPLKRPAATRAGKAADCQDKPSADTIARRPTPKAPRGARD